MVLTAKQEAFAVRVVAGDSLADAYRATYSASRATDKTVWESGSKLAAKPKVSARIKELRGSVADSAKYSLEEHLDQLRKLSLAAAKNEQFSVSVTAEQHRGAALGFYALKKQLEISGPRGGPIETQATGPDLARLSVDELRMLRQLTEKTIDAPADPSGD
uniref:Putative terminase n=2 Tax=viral metagenome TaxID=1070528 RepID=A0A6M3KT82_9ZZZZ